MTPLVLSLLFLLIQILLLGGILWIWRRVFSVFLWIIIPPYVWQTIGQLLLNWRSSPEGNCVKLIFVVLLSRLILLLRHSIPLLLLPLSLSHSCSCYFSPPEFPVYQGNIAVYFVSEWGLVCLCCSKYIFVHWVQTIVFGWTWDRSWEWINELLRSTYIWAKPQDEWRRSSSFNISITGNNAEEW